MFCFLLICSNKWHVQLTWRSLNASSTSAFQPQHLNSSKFLLHDLVTCGLYTFKSYYSILFAVEVDGQTYHWLLCACSYLLPLALSPQWPDMDQSHPELGFTSRKQRCTHGSLSSTHCGHGYRYPSYRPLTGCDHEGTNSSQRESVVDEVSGKKVALSHLQSGES